MTQAEKAARFAELHAKPEPFVIPNPWDAGSARALTQAGFSALTTTSSALAFSLGKRDGAREMTRDDALANARSIVDATDLPVAADLENGYGDDPGYVAETIRLAAAVGLVGASIEDATGDPNGPMYCLEHAVARIAAAADAVRALPFPFMLVARAENFLRGNPNLDDTIERLRAYEAAGADVLYAPLLPDAHAIARVCAAVKKPVNVLAAGSLLTMSVRDLGALGVRRISLGGGLHRIAMATVGAASRELLERGTFSALR